MRSSGIALGVAIVVLGGGALLLGAQKKHTNTVIDLWMQGKPAFGVFVPDENPPARPPIGGRGAPAAAREALLKRPAPRYTRDGAATLAANPLYDYVFLNLEGAYDAAAVSAVVAGLRTAKTHKAVLVRVPAFHEDEAAGRARLREVFAAGADGITFPHVKSLDEARRIIAAAAAEKIDVWSPATPGGEKLLMLMLEDPNAAAQAREFASLKGYSILACGIGSLTGALNGDRSRAEQLNQSILAESKRAGLVNMLTANTADVEKRVKEGYLALLMNGRRADEAIQLGRTAAGR